MVVLVIVYLPCGNMVGYFCNPLIINKMQESIDNEFPDDFEDEEYYRAINEQRIKEILEIFPDILDEEW